ncbi:two-component sensor histidine kinase [Actinokineospora bangkokensis]|uniref:histidine kinase n=2 Tax=Actinokineospora bangkokensis TaxID=1193682 RepID=A0A1Q9LP20_9PSEU|nr:two-component sensor histidine kinase [Actinokineospora bangkokensis]
MLSPPRDQAPEAHRREAARIAVVAALLAALDLSLGLGDAPTTGFLGPHAGLTAQLLADASLLLAARFPRAVGAFVLLVGAAMAISSQLAPGLLLPPHQLSPVTVPRATPVVVILVALHQDRRYALALTALFAVFAGRLWAPDWSITPFGLLSTLGPALGALYFDARRQLVRSLRDRAERAEREQLLLAERARFEERRRLASEMHDVVTHRLSLIVLHAGALRVSSTDEAVRAAADDIRASGSQAMKELHDLIGVLRSPNADEPLVAGAAEPATAGPIAADLDTLVAESNAVGMPTEVEVIGAVTALTPAVARTAHRVVQEALTNARKHSPGSRVKITLRYQNQDVRVRVTNTAPTAEPDPVLSGSGSGAGLTGLRHRIEVIGGKLEAGPTDSGGFRLDAILPAYVPTPESRPHDPPGPRR